MFSMPFFLVFNLHVNGRYAGSRAGRVGWKEARVCHLDADIRYTQRGKGKCLYVSCIVVIRTIPGILYRNIELALVISPFSTSPLN